jgi:hypothetical protein
MMIFRNKIFARIILFVLLGFAFASCKTNYAFLSIENIQRAPNQLPDDIQSITLVNRSMGNEFKNYIADSLEMHFLRNGFQLSEMVPDSAAADTTIKALAALMYESGRYDVVIPVERNLKRNLSTEILPDTLSRQQVTDICNNYNTDAVLVLERFWEKPMADLSKERFFDPKRGYCDEYNATLDLAYQAIIRIYRPFDKTLVKQIELNDTIYWESSEETLRQLFSKLPTVKQALINGAIKVALDLDSQLSPSWIPEKRGYYLFKAEDDPGQKYMNENNLEKAAQYWEEMEKSNNKKIKSKAQYNLALINELNGDLDKAIEYGLKSFYTFYRQPTEAYLKRLEARKLAQKKTK